MSAAKNSQNDNYFRLLAARLDPNIAVIDLHQAGTIPAAIEQLERELFLLYKEGKLYCRVVHGIGTGALAAAAPRVLPGHTLVKVWECEDGAACLVALERAVY